MAQEITTYDEVSTIDKNTKLLLTKDGGLGQKSIEEVGNVINGTGDISGIGDGTVKGAIRGLNDEINYTHIKSRGFGNSNLTITFEGNVSTRMVVALLIVTGQNGISNVIPIMFSGNSGIHDVRDCNGIISEYGTNLGVSFEGNVLTIPSIFGGWGSVSIIQFEKNLKWIIE